MNPLKRDSPDNSVAPPLNIVLINSKTNSSFNDEHRRLIAKFSPVCYAYNYHLILVNFKIETSPLDFAKEIAPSTSIGKSGERLIELAKKGMIKITNLPISGDLGKIVICTSKPEKSKAQDNYMISELLIYWEYDRCKFAKMEEINYIL